MGEMMLARPGKLKDEEMMSVREYLLTAKRILPLTGVLRDESDSCNLLMALSAHDPVSPIIIIITSPGGVVDDAMAIYDTMRLIPNPIITVGRFCASAAAILMAAGDKRYLFPRAKMMLHQPSGYISGNAEEITIQKDEMDKTYKLIVDALIECGVKKTAKNILADLKLDKWFDAKEAIAYGLADEILTPAIMKDILGYDKGA